MSYAKHLARHQTPPTTALPGQVPNSAGGYVFPVTCWTRLDRFLVLGAEGGTYYAQERQLVLNNVQALEECLAEDGPETVERIVAVSESGRAVKNEAAVMALAICLKRGDEEARQLAAAAVKNVCRIGTDLFHLAQYVETLGGWGRNVRRAFAGWYDRPNDRLATQVIKYQQRDGWSHRDVLRKCHAKTKDPVRNALYRYAVKGWDGVGPEPHSEPDLRQVWAFEAAKTARGDALLDLIRTYRLPHECVPNDAKGDAATWAAMLPSMGLTAVLRNLGKMTAVGLLQPLGAATATVCARLQDPEELHRARLHPLKVLVALRTYAQGHGDKGKLRWQPVTQVVNALENGFYAAFKAVEPTGKRFCLALDVSGSMGHDGIAGLAGMTPREVACVMALATAAVEPQHVVLGFTSAGQRRFQAQATPHRFTNGYQTMVYPEGDGVSELPIHAGMRLNDAVKTVSGLPFGRTDCSLPMEWALANRVPVDVFCVYTDNETYAGRRQPVEALRDYREQMGIPARLVVVAMTATGFTIADPTDGGMLDVVGASQDLPAVIADFAR